MPGPGISQSYQSLVVLAVAVPGLYWLLVLFGRRLKRRHGVRLGWLYHLFSLCLAVYVPALALDLPWSFLRHLGAAVIILSSTVLIAIVDRYVWDLHFKERHGVVVPKFLSELGRLAILAVAVFLVLQLFYDQGTFDSAWNRRGDPRFGDAGFGGQRDCGHGSAGRQVIRPWGLADRR